MGYCPRCRDSHPDTRFCPVHGVALADSDDLDRLGRDVAGYQLTDLLGRGGMATVYRGEWNAGRDVAAIKILHPAFSDPPHEILAAVAPVVGLTHPGLVEVCEAGFDPSCGVFFRMDFVAGPTLADLLDREPLPLAPALALLDRVAAALEIYHGAGPRGSALVHRDLKPENLLVPAGDPARTRVLDLPDSSVARVLMERGTVGGIFGTPQYMAPEVVRRQSVDARADLYALGVVLFEAVTGTRPFDGDDPARVMALHLEGEPPSPPAGLETLLPLLLAREPENRLPSARALRARLRELRGAKGADC